MGRVEKKTLVPRGQEVVYALIFLLDVKQNGRFEIPTRMIRHSALSTT